jgi:hypothetical protein
MPNLNQQPHKQTNNPTTQWHETMQPETNTIRIVEDEIALVGHPCPDLY